VFAVFAFAGHGPGLERTLIGRVGSQISKR
jgi:hypothetical protein